MASLNKLAIRGIRSFDDKQIAVIEFFSPVTVIVGHNGSGKTTIIECLKYATTGDQPPNTRGGAFIHDPKMANEKEVKAQVKLRFHAANGQRMLAVRNLSVTVKKTSGLTMKTLESILSLADGNPDKGGKRATISTKCAEIDTEIPNLLGVSKSVLENVIFCHQEDSYWPLAEPAALKKKFDDIFEATRYSKALDSIKSLRKDRVAELKADKERLLSLSREKGHADKLKARVSDLNATIAMKEIEHETLKQEHDVLMETNKRFYDSATKFRELYIKVENLQARQKGVQREIQDCELNTREVSDSDDQLQERLNNFEKHSQNAKERLRQERVKLQDAEENIDASRKAHVELKQQQGQLLAEEKQHERNIAERDAEICRIAGQFDIKGFEHSPLEREQIVSFLERLRSMKRSRVSELEALQKEAKVQTDDFNLKSRKLHSENDSSKQQKDRLRNDIVSLQASISAAETELDASQSLVNDLSSLQTDLDEKRARIEKIKADIKTSSYDDKIHKKTVKIRTMEEERDVLNGELRGLTHQADAIARLDIKRTELKTKTQDVNILVTTNNSKFRKLVGIDINANAMERDIDRALGDKERDCSEAETEYDSVNKTLQRAESTLSNLKAQLKQKRDEMRALDKLLKEGLQEHSTVQEAIDEAGVELNLRKEESGTMAGSSKVYELLLKTGKSKKTCTACNRPLEDHEMPTFEKYLHDQMKKTSPETIATNKQEIADWEYELKRLQGLLPSESTRDRLKSAEIPKLEVQIKELEAGLPATSNLAESALDKLNEVKRELKETTAMKQQASTLSRFQSEIERLEQEISRLEDDLSTAGSTKTADDVQRELDAVADEIRASEREKHALSADRERQNQILRTHENDLHAMQLRESELKSQLREKQSLEVRIVSMRKDIAGKTGELKDIEAQISAAKAPMEELDRQLKEFQIKSHAQIAQVQEQCQELSRNEDSLERINKAVEVYVRNKRGRHLQACMESIESREMEIKESDAKIEHIRESIADIEKEINEGGAVVVNLRENVRLRRLKSDLASIQTEIDSYDMEEAGRARRQFNEKYGKEKERESQLQGQYAHVGGELTSLKAQVRTLESDLKDFKDIGKLYTDQLIKVKMSDMANNDLEKYSKALDNAIMKYHSLKMEEVNDTMRHLWNKTYQGTDIDGIKIRSDVEGGASKRSYNYRVVMTKDQVEMDMRGRCSAGQKMLASIVIRLALSDSFGQNCGILALDEPTNALDIENIDALASSLVDIINERKNHANFQLIIITHDENFLRKLGQADVMEYYWRVSRDTRQKSVIERQRFG